MGFEDLRIRDISRISGEWAPPIGAMGGPPAHELYRDLVMYAGLQLFQDKESHPWVVFRDGAHRRPFAVPSVQLRNALDRFRMHRNSRPVPGSDLEEFVRIVEARISDPDVKIPTLRGPLVEGPESVEERRAHPTTEIRTGAWDRDGAEGAGITTDGAEAGRSAYSPPEHPADSPLRESGSPPRPPAASDIPLGVRPGISGGMVLSTAQGANVARYVRVLRSLLRSGDWMGTTRELSEATRDDPLTLYGSLLRYRAELADNDILVTSVDLDEGFRWLVVDRARVRDATDEKAHGAQDPANGTASEARNPSSAAPEGPREPAAGPAPAATTAG